MKNVKPLLIPAIAGLLLIGIGYVIHEEEFAFDLSLYPHSYTLILNLGQLCKSAGGFVIAISAISAFCSYLANPFRYPYFTKEFDVSGRRKPSINSEIEDWLCEPSAWEYVERHLETVRQWKQASQSKVDKSLIRKRRQRQLERTIDDDGEFQFIMTRQQTRYKQINYTRYPYTVTVPEDLETMSFDELEEIHEQLAEIGFECNLSQYHSKNQRKLMTPKLRREIAERDGYTCQNCGKYMPDGVGLHIDHIIPVSKGGKTMPSNLQVLCSKCNGRKGNRD